MLVNQPKQLSIFDLASAFWSSGRALTELDGPQGPAPGNKTPKLDKIELVDPIPPFYPVTAGGGVRKRIDGATCEAYTYAYLGISNTHHIFGCGTHRKNKGRGRERETGI